MEESGKAKASVIAVVPAIVLLVPMFQLQSFQRVALVLSAAPLGLIGVVAALLLAQPHSGSSPSAASFHRPGEARGAHPWDSVVTAAMHRTRPILLTASAAILGMIPIAPTVF